MTAPAHTLAENLRADFTQARADLMAARHTQQTKDTPAHRAAVARQRARIDAVLDLHLELSDPQGWNVDQLATFSTVRVPQRMS
jgi:hypothetical protein